MTKTQTYWSDDHIEILKKHHGTMSNREVANIIGKTAQAIQHMAHRIGITTRRVANYKQCIDCGKKLSRASCYTASERCRECADTRNRGENHHNWKGGVASLRSLVHVLLKPVWIDPIMKRDHYMCQFCLQQGGDKHVHHIYPYRVIRDEVVKRNKSINVRTFEGRSAMALKIVEAHKLRYGITLCVPCHKKVHDEKRGELLGPPTAIGEDNQQPSRSNVMKFVGRKVQRLTGEDSQANKPDTSAPVTVPLFGNMI